ncbi:MAG TPA: dihydrodipicolinate synthase family protein [Sediminispirochaeta sp.]|nr:dihydrodipicolinate synthase family protein [Sediminispirochaeta sp.]
MKRQEIGRRYFPKGMPRLWCPLISHYQRDGSFDQGRTEAHIAHLRRYVSAFLAPGSTGDGWEMDKGRRSDLIEMLKKTIEAANGRLLVGVLETELGAAAREVRSLAERYDFEEDPCLCGVTVTAPKGAELDQEVIAAELAEVLEQEIPTALYQLPQITENEIQPETTVRLAAEFPNFYLFKDTSGEDAVAMSDGVPEDVFLLRGAEGDYLSWYRAAGGPYDGFLLSTANGFAPQLSRIIELSEQAEREPEDRAALKEAKELSALLSRVVQDCFATVQDLPFGNPFANANKAVDHWMAFGPGAMKKSLPYTCSGYQIPKEVIDRVGTLLSDAALLPSRSYLD